jgi:hypothetical protein
MFTTAQKREIAEKVQRALRETGNLELPQGEIVFHLHVVGADPTWSWADILNNGAVLPQPGEPKPREYKHFLACNGDRRYPAGEPGHCCSCFNGYHTAMRGGQHG